MWVSRQRQQGPLFSRTCPGNKTVSFRSSATQLIEHIKDEGMRPTSGCGHVSFYSCSKERKGPQREKKTGPHPPRPARPLLKISPLSLLMPPPHPPLPRPTRPPRPHRRQRSSTPSSPPSLPPDPDHVTGVQRQSPQPRAGVQGQGGANSRADARVRPRPQGELVMAS